MYISNWTENIFSLLSMIEPWMVNGTDQWYLKTEIWNSLPDSRKKEILEAMVECEQNIGEEYHLSIFDDLRTEFLSILKDNEEPTSDDNYWNLVN